MPTGSQEPTYKPQARKDVLLGGLFGVWGGACAAADIGGWWDVAFAIVAPALFVANILLRAGLARLSERSAYLQGVIDTKEAQLAELENQRRARGVSETIRRHLQ